MMNAKDPANVWWTQLANRMREARIAKKFTQEQCAAFTGLSRTSYTNFEAGRQRMDLFPFLQLCRGLQVDPSTMLPESIEAAVRREINPMLTRLDEERVRRGRAVGDWYKAQRTKIDVEFRRRCAAREAKASRWIAR